MNANEIKIIDNVKGRTLLFKSKEVDNANKILAALETLSIEECMILLDKCKQAIMQCKFTIH